MQKDLAEDAESRNCLQQRLSNWVAVAQRLTTSHMPNPVWRLLAIFQTRRDQDPKCRQGYSAARLSPLPKTWGHGCGQLLSYVHNAWYGSRQALKCGSLASPYTTGFHRGMLMSGQDYGDETKRRIPSVCYTVWRRLDVVASWW